MTHPHPHPHPDQQDYNNNGDWQQQQQQQPQYQDDYNNQQQQGGYGDPYNTNQGYGHPNPQTGLRQPDVLSKCGGDTACCIAACFFPSIAYGVNYRLARQEPLGTCCLPCIANTTLDCLPYAVLSIVLSALHMPLMCATFPLGCVCRAQQRYAVFGFPQAHSDIVQPSEKEHCLESVALETACWGCSLAQMHTRLSQRKNRRSHAPIAGNDLLGTLHTPPTPANTMGSQDPYNNNGYSTTNY